MLQLLLKTHLTKLALIKSIKSTKNKIEKLEKEKREQEKRVDALIRQQSLACFRKAASKRLHEIYRTLPLEDKELEKQLKKLGKLDLQLTGLLANFTYRVPTSQRMKFCLVSLSPTILELPLSRDELANIPRRITRGISSQENLCFDILPKDLVPIEAGCYSLITNCAYLYLFDNPVAAKDGQQKHFEQALKRSKRKVIVSTLDADRKFIVPKHIHRSNAFFLAKEKALSAIEKEHISASEALNRYLVRMVQQHCRKTISVISPDNPESFVVEMAFKNLFGPFMPLHEVTNIDFLLEWIADQCLQSDSLVIKGNTFPTNDYVTYHANSKPDFYLFDLEESWGIVCDRINESLDEETDEDTDEGTDEGRDEERMETVLQGIAGENKMKNATKCSMEGKTKYQLQANMLAVAGCLAQTALEREVDFDKIVIYGIGCIYETDKAYLVVLTLDFKWQLSEFCTYGEHSGIGEVVSYVLKRCGVWKTT